MKLLAAIDRLLAPATWVVAGVLALMLLVGPRVVADDSAPAPGKPGAQSYGGGGAPDGRAVFAKSCGSCHTLAAAGTSGQVGPKLDGLKLDAATVSATVRSGSGVMPAFKGKLSDPEIAAVATFVATASQ